MRAAEVEMGLPRAASLMVDIKLSGGADFASPEELDLRNTLMDLVERRGIGRVDGSGSGLGSMDFSITVADKKSARARIARLIRKLAPGAEFEIRAYPVEDSEGG